MKYDENPMSFDMDIALSMIAQMRSDAIRRKHATTDEKEREDITDEIRIYNTEEYVIYYYRDKEVRQSVFDKVFRFYGPILREERKKALSKST
ncbi:MAG: hypothetical protein IJV33_06855 [Bacteroidaceae bacterium]|nr:hypothetical protein [Bacteroidaceae bacterium]